MFVKNIVRETKINDLFSVKDKVVLIGGAGGLGSCLAKGFLDNGAYVVLADNAPGKAEKIKGRLKNQLPPQGSVEMLLHIVTCLQ